MAQYISWQGQLHKLKILMNSQQAIYQLCVDKQTVPLNARLGAFIEINDLGSIHCLSCGRKTAKSFAQGYCYPCFSRLPQCDRCIISPKYCHYDQGTCRDPVWGQQHCMTDHIVYLANTSALKVGITRHTQLSTRWLDQGAVQALPILRVNK